MSHSWCNLYTKFIMSHIKLHFTCDESTLHCNSSNIPKYYHQDCLKKLYLHFASLIMIEISGHSPILFQNRKILPTKVESILMSVFNLNRMWEVVPNWKRLNQNFSTVCFLCICIKDVVNPRFEKIFQYMRFRHFWVKKWNLLK